MCLSESRINQIPSTNIDLSDYKLIYIMISPHVRGVAIYIATKGGFKTILNLNLNSEECEKMRKKLTNIQQTTQSSF